MSYNLRTGSYKLLQVEALRREVDRLSALLSNQRATSRSKEPLNIKANGRLLSRTAADDRLLRVPGAEEQEPDVLSLDQLDYSSNQLSSTDDDDIYEEACDG